MIKNSLFKGAAFLAASLFVLLAASCTNPADDTGGGDPHKTEAEKFIDGYTAILGKTVDTIAVTDEAAVVAALAAWEKLADDVKDLLRAEKTLLDTLETKIIELGIPSGGVYMAPDGNDDNSGTIDAPVATIAKAQQLVAPGGTVYMRGGTYTITEAQIARNDGIYALVFDMNKSGTPAEKINYWAYPVDKERPVFDLSQVKPANMRVTVFYVSGSNLHFKGFDVVGTQVTIVDHTQSECFRVNGGNNNVFEKLYMHDGMAIGIYLIKGRDNLIVDCDAYNNWDSVSEGGRGGNVDGFGGHLNDMASTGNVFRNCRAWLNSDDGFDLINCFAAVTIENCWASYNGYNRNADGSHTSRGDGTGIKAGGFGMSASLTKYPSPIPRHTIRFSLVAGNKKGFYSNHHLGGNDWFQNTAYNSGVNFNMINRKTAAEAVDVGGYDHVLKNNLSYSSSSNNHVGTTVDETESTLDNNSWQMGLTLSSSDFVSMDPLEIEKPRKADGSLPDIGFMKPRAGSQLVNKGIDVGLPYNGAAPELGYMEL